MKENNHKEKAESADFESQFNEMMLASTTNFVVQTQWKAYGDTFQKLSMYDQSYVPVRSLGSTTLIKNT